LLAAGPKLGGVELNADNCLAYTFGTPDTVVQPNRDAPWITNIVSGNDPFDHILPHWEKYGNTVGYDYDRSVIEKIFGGKPDTGFFRGHQADNYIANVLTSNPKDSWKNEEERFFWEGCPTDVKVIYNDTIVASVINGKALSDGSVVIGTNENGEKTVLTPDDDGYRIITEATGDGTMSIVTNSSSDPGVEPAVYDIVKGQVYEIDYSTQEVKVLNNYQDPKRSFGLMARELFSPVIDWLGGSSDWEALTGRLISITAAIAFMISIIVLSISRRRKHKRK
jgi:hypothetical protein